MMTTALLGLLGRLSLPFERIRLSHGVSNSESTTASKPVYDKTGIVSDAAHPVKVVLATSDLLYVQYRSIAHSFWRAQELSLFRRHVQELEAPILDFGTGDGSFASVLFERIDFGVDNDPEALERARELGTYEELLRWREGGIPLASGSVQTVVSNSVLEHVSELETVLGELRRVLVTDGLFVFTVPVAEYSAHLVTYFGAHEAERINAESTHRNLLTPKKWEELLMRAGFRVESMLSYQPPIFTFWYRMFRLLGPRGLGRIIPRLPEKFWHLLRAWAVSMIRKSIAGVENGANVFVMARAVEDNSGR